MSPALRAPSPTRARHAVRPAVVMVAASAWLQPFGAWVKAPAGRPRDGPRNRRRRRRGSPRSPDRAAGGAVRPLREEARHDGIAGPELGDAGADRLDHAGPVRHQHPAVLGRRPAARHDQVVVVERGGVDRDPDLAGSGSARIGPLRDLQPVEAARARTHDDRLHDNSWFRHPVWGARPGTPPDQRSRPGRDRRSRRAGDSQAQSPPNRRSIPLMRPTIRSPSRSARDTISSA